MGREFARFVPQEQELMIVRRMALKAPVVYGELSLLLSQIRHKIEHNADGSPFEYVAPHLPRNAH